MLERHSHIGILADAIYEHNFFEGGACCSVLHIATSLADRTMWVNGVSEAYAMTDSESQLRDAG